VRCGTPAGTDTRAGHWHSLKEKKEEEEEEEKKKKQKVELRLD
jgi:hypothetical protein